MTTRGRVRRSSALAAVPALALWALMTAPSASASARDLFYVANTVSNEVDLVDASNYQTMGTIRANFTPDLFYQSPRVPGKAYLLSVVDDKVVVLDTRSDTVSSLITIPAYSELAAFSPDAKRLYVAYFSLMGQTNGVAVIDTETDKMIEDIRYPDAPLPNQAAVVTASPDGHYLYTADYFGGVSQYDLALHRVVRITSLGLIAPTPSNVYTSPNGNLLYSVNIECLSHTGSVSVIDTRTFKVINTLAVGPNPFVNEVRPGTAELWLTSATGHRITVLDLAPPGSPEPSTRIDPRWGLASTPRVGTPTLSGTTACWLIRSASGS